MRSALILALALSAAVASAQTTGLPRFEDYPSGPVYRGRVAPLVESSSPTARMYRTRTREALSEGVNFAGHYVVATWGCGTACMWGHIVDARTGRAVEDLPFATPYMTFRPDSRLITVMTPDEILERFPTRDDGPIPSHYVSSYWVLENGALRHLGSLLASDIEQIRSGSAVPALRQVSPGDVLVPLAVGNTWRYAGPNGTTVTLRVTGPDPEPYSDGMRVERVVRSRAREDRTVETWTTGRDIGDGSLSIRPAGDEAASFGYVFGVPEAYGSGSRVERTTVRVGAASHEAVCYVTDAGTSEESGARVPVRTCFVPRIGMVSDDRTGPMTLTAYTLR